MSEVDRIWNSRTGNIVSLVLFWRDDSFDFVLAEDSTTLHAADLLKIDDLSGDVCSEMGVADFVCVVWTLEAWEVVGWQEMLADDAVRHFC